jgi:hypothetical protein
LTHQYPGYSWRPCNEFRKKMLISERARNEIAGVSQYGFQLAGSLPLTGKEKPANVNAAGAVAVKS